MELIADTSVLLAVVLNEPEKRIIIKASTGYDLIGPAVIPWEIGNALSAMFKRRKISLRDAQKVFKAFQSIPIRYMDVDIENAFCIAHDQAVYAYDAYFLACAKSAHAPIMALDKQLLSKAQLLDIDIVEI